MAINQNDKVIRQIMVNDTPHEICSKYLGGYTYDEIHQEIQDSVGSGVQDLALTPLKNVTYYDLVNLRNDGLLVPGQSYRIIDYVTTTTEENTKSAKHNFDIIVKALNNNTLSENAKACRCFNSKRDHGVENTTSDMYNWPDVNNWAAYGTSNGGPTLPPDAIELMGNSSVSTQLGTRTITSNSKIRITLLGKKSDDTVIRGFGAALIQNNTIIDIDFGNGTEFYLQLPSGYSDGSYELRFYAYGTTSELIDGIAGACAESFDATSHFNDSNLNAWEIKYSLDNDTNRFVWADAVNGKGVIYYMKDEFNNECWYDFKNIQFNCVVKQTHNNEEVEFRPDGYDYAYTFTDYDGNDLSLTQNARNNSIKKYTNSGNGLQSLNHTLFICSSVHNNIIEENSYSNVFYVNTCYYNTIGKAFQNNFISAPSGENRASIHNNIIGTLFKSNRILSSFSRNTIGNTTTSCDFFNAFAFNKLGNNSWHIDFNYPISYCVFGSYIQYCVFHNTDAYPPAVSEMKWCTIGDGLEGVQYIPCCQKVTFENRVLYNSSSNFHINDVVLNDGTKLVEQLVQQHEDQLYVCSVDDGCTVFRYKNTVSEINLGTFDSIESVASKAAEIDICSNQNITRISFKIDNDGRRYANGFIEQFISGGPYTVSGTELYYIVQTLYFNGETSSRQIVYTINDSVKIIKSVGGWLKIIDHDNSNTESPILYSRSSEVVNIASSQTIIGNKRFDSDINLAGKTIIKNGSNIDKGEFKVFNATDSGAGFTIRTNGKFDNNVPILEMLATNNRAAYKYQFPQLANTTDHDFVVVKSQLDGVVEDEKKYVCIEWGELVSLRDNGELNPGRKYRITDYVTTTSQPNTQSAGHQFDIIVEALNENTLSEDVKAIQNENDVYFNEANLEAWELKYCLDNDTSRFAWANNEIIENGLTNIPIICSEFVDTAGNVTYEDEINTHNDYFIKYGYENDIEGNERLVIYKTDPSEYPSEVDYQDKFFFEGVGEIDGVEYNKWRKIDNSYGWDADGKLYVYTEIIVENNQIKNEYINNGCLGKGVIYYMKDEWNNEAPYDFKNIKFYREEQDKYVFTFSWINEIDEVEDLTLRQDLLSDDGTAYGTHYNIIKSYYQYGSLPCLALNDIVFINTYDYESGYFYGCNSNTFGNYCYSNTFGNYCYSNTFGNDCYLNTFGNECYSNTFGNDCYLNTFGNECYSNTFGNECYSNSFGNYCHLNTFGNECHSNTFGNHCDLNTFGNYCGSNTFGFDGYNNHFGNNCSLNIFGDKCKTNTFGQSCTSNTFGQRYVTNTFGNYCIGISFYDSGTFSKTDPNRLIYIGDGNKLNDVKEITLNDSCRNLLFYNNDGSAIQNITVNKGVKCTELDQPGGIEILLPIEIPVTNNDYELKISKNSLGQIKIYCEADLIR